MSWLLRYSAQTSPAFGFSNHRVQLQDGSWQFYQDEVDGKPLTIFTSPLSLWRCNVAQIDQPVGNEDRVSCRVLVSKYEMVADVVFQRSLICRTPEIASRVNGFLAELVEQ